MPQIRWGGKRRKPEQLTIPALAPSNPAFLKQTPQPTELSRLIGSGLTPINSIDIIEVILALLRAIPPGPIGGPPPTKQSCTTPDSGSGTTATAAQPARSTHSGGTD